MAQTLMLWIMVESKLVQMFDQYEIKQDKMAYTTNLTVNNLSQMSRSIM